MEQDDADPRLEELAAQLKNHGAAFLDPHPESALVVQYATDPTAKLAEGAHLATCPSCMAEVEAVRTADREWSAPAGLERAPRRRWWRELITAAAACAALAIPAYLGLRVLPQTRAELEAARRELAGSHAEVATTRRALDEARAALERERQFEGGAAPLLLFAPRTRGGNDRPRIALPAGRRWQPIAAVVDLDAEPGFEPGCMVQVAISRASGALAWSSHDRANALWEPSTSLLSVIVPAGRLAAGLYQFEVRLEGAAHPALTASFTVQTADR